MSYHHLRHVKHSHLTEDSYNKFLVEEKNDIFCCGGCGKLGQQRRYTCATDNCGFSLHIACGEAKDSILHPFYQGSTFEFLADAASGVSCDCCGESIQGNSYHSRDKQKYLHLICADLPHHLYQPRKKTSYTLHPNMQMFSKCYKCGKHKLDNGIDGWSYVSDGHCHTKSHYHVVCLQDIVGGDIGMCIGPSVVGTTSRGVESDLVVLEVATECATEAVLHAALVLD